MAREMEKVIRPAQMPEEQLRRSSRIQQQKRQAESGKGKAADYEAPNLPRSVNRHEKASRPGKRKAEKELQGPTGPADRAKVRKVESSGESHEQDRKKETAKQSKARTEKRLKQAQGITNPLRGKEKPRKQPPRVENVSRPPSTSLSRAALRQLRNETANDPLPEDLEKVNFPFDMHFPRSHIASIK
jgi:hypothetical protein